VKIEASFPESLFVIGHSAVSRAFALICARAYKERVYLIDPSLPFGPVKRRMSLDGFGSSTMYQEIEVVPLSVIEHLHSLHTHAEGIAFIFGAVTLESYRQIKEFMGDKVIVVGDRDASDHLELTTTISLGWEARERLPGMIKVTEAGPLRLEGENLAKVRKILKELDLPETRKAPKAPPATWRRWSESL